MSHLINTIRINTTELLDRSVGNIEQVQSIRSNPLNGSFLACYPVASIGENDSTGNVILYPPNPLNEDYASTTIKEIDGYGSLDFPLDSVWNPFNGRYWIADAGNGNLVALNSTDNSFARSISGFTLPHSIILNKNDRSIFVKSFVDENTQKVTQVNNRAEIIFEFEFPGEISSTVIDYTTTFLKKIPKYFTMDYDANLNRLWFVSGTILYMIDFDMNQITEKDLSSVWLNKLTCVSIDRSSGNAFVIISDSVNYYIHQIFKDNNLLLGTSYLEEQPLI